MPFKCWSKRRRRDDLGITQEELAALLCCSTERVSDIERGKRLPSKDLAEQLAEAFGIAPADRPAFVLHARRRPGTPLSVPSPDRQQPAETVRTCLGAIEGEPVMLRTSSAGQDDGSCGQTALVLEVLGELPGDALMVKVRLADAQPAAG